MTKMTIESYDLYIAMSKDPSLFAESVLGKLTQTERNMLTDIHTGDKVVRFDRNRSSANKMSMMYAIWRTVFLSHVNSVVLTYDPTNVLLMLSDAINTINNLPEWMTLEYETVVDHEESYAGISLSNGSRLAFAAVGEHANVLRGMTIQTLVAQDTGAMQMDAYLDTLQYCGMITPEIFGAKAILTNSRHLVN